MFETIVVLTYAFIANIPMAKFSWLYYITLYNANSLKIPLNYVIFVKGSLTYRFFPRETSYVRLGVGGGGGGFVAVTFLCKHHGKIR